MKWTKCAEYLCLDNFFCVVVLCLILPPKNILGQIRPRNAFWGNFEVCTLTLCKSGVLMIDPW